MKINGYTRMAAVVANPIKHSLSPMIHNTAFDETGCNGVYVAWEITEDDLQATVENIRRYDMFGINLSMPYKTAVIPYLDELSPEAKLIGAVNTVVNKNGHLIGYSTDGAGFFASLGDFKIKDQELVIIGAGGAGLSIIAQAALDGAKAIHIYCRSQSVEKVWTRVRLISEETKVSITVTSLDDVTSMQKDIQSSSLLVNASSLGMDGTSNPLSNDIKLPKSIIVADVIYQPFETVLLKRAKQEGLLTINGLGMLLHQAALAFELWTNYPMPVNRIWPLLEDLVKKGSRKES
ncbi:shikimate dehydrogenase [Streptococcus moroccensis]|uniref:Shikimate dehydrogenase (NADP(+)) n=1 Tax=Streptococcus moroccensis TaxID=1451356 RepID=A0ABT9YUK2_9STRE|nr:shikimate dehydrogenase [Streptococcus moroccensis]MDQ0223282.1 shikimate dehydrogenase [Streptococcus moroccensis]